MMEMVKLDCQVSKMTASKQRAAWVADLITMDDAEAMIDALYANERERKSHVYDDLEERLNEERINIQRRNNV
jgi:hypothetical protein